MDFALEYRIVGAAGLLWWMIVFCHLSDDAISGVSRADGRASTKLRHFRSLLRLRSPAAYQARFFQSSCHEKAGKDKSSHENK